MHLINFWARICLLIPLGCFWETSSYGINGTLISTLPRLEQPSITWRHHLLPISYQKEQRSTALAPIKENSLSDRSIFNSPSEKIIPEKIHPRKKLLEGAGLHTERSWLYSAIVPGLGQLYNKNYWRLPLIYGIFAGLAWGAIYNHDEYMTARRELIEKTRKLKKKDKDLSSSNLTNFMEGRKRDRTIFVVALGVWHFINIFDAYVAGTLKTFDVSDDLEVIIKPSEMDIKNPGIGLNFSLQPKDKKI